MCSKEIPNDSAAALILLEHHWAVPLRDAVVRAAGGFRISDGFISPRDFAEIGLHSAEEAEPLHALETAAQNDLHTNPWRQEMFGSRRMARRTSRRGASRR